MKKNDLIQGRIGKAILLFVLPLIAGSLIQQLYVTVDAVIVGQFAGKTGLAAIDSVHTLFKFPLNFMNGLAAGATIMISGYYGAKDHEGMRCSIRTALTVALGLGTFCSAAGILLAPWLLTIMQVPEGIWQDTLMYSQIYFGGLWAMVLYNMSAGILRAFGDSKRPLYVLIVCSIVNILGDLLLVGFFHMGVAGAAIATVFSQIISVVCTFYFLEKLEDAGDTCCGEHGAHVWVPHYCREHMTLMVGKGFPLALQSMLFPIANSIVQASVNSMGTDSIAAWGICDKLSMLIWLIADCMSPAMTTYVAQNLGAGKADRVKKGALTGTGISVSAVLFVSLILYLLSGVIGSWFISAADAPALIPLVIRYMRMMAPFYFFYAIAEALSGATCGLGATMTSMITTMITICALRVVSILFVLPAFGTMECIIWIYIASWIAAGCAFAGVFVWKEREKMQSLNFAS